ncbi:hypothetical protein DID88_008770 [Monilinia fructigena]|uniref:Transcription factor domain-containing protein n=1 Tax=Monilinia fructigena TaxID=38457 RepID=A0A395J6D1_9HELO|nr:hypothetical protein DID88_008770 [Monilinia fructigena]
MLQLRRPGNFPNDTQPELLERIRKLEEIVESQKSQTNGNAVRYPQQSPESPESSGTPYTLRTNTSRSSLSPDIENLDNDVAFLKSIYTAQNLSDNTPSTKIAFSVCPIQQIPQAQPYINENAHLSPARFEPFRCVWLPQYAEAKVLLQKFIDDIDHVHHITHTPSLPAILEGVYFCLNQQGQIKPGSIILLLGIFASATHAWVQRDSVRELFPTWQEANAQALLWVKAVEDVLDIFHRTSSVPIEGIQGISITVFTVLNMEGFSLRCKSLFNMAFMLARELGLHFLDQPSNKKLTSSAQTEIGRRVWWFLVAADWSLPSRRFNCGSQNIYHCHPRHMLVKKPLNINDEDVIDGMRGTEQPLSQPTTMSFQLLQLRLSEISHNMVDRSPLIMGLSGGLSHDVVMNIDTELQMLLNDTPPFFSMSVPELTANYQLDPSHASKIKRFGSSKRQKHESETAKRFLDSLTHVLRKHEVSPASKPAEQLPITPNTAFTGLQPYGDLPLPLSPSSLVGANDVILGNPMYANGEDVSTYFNELAQTFEQGTEVGNLDWNNMFSGIDSSMVWI